MPPKKKILVLGGTGPTGLLFVQKALNAGYALTVYARSPEKLGEEVRARDDVVIVKGTLTDFDLLTSTVATHHAIVSLLGPNSLRTTSRIFTDAYAALLAGMRAASVCRIFVLGSVSVPDAHDSPGLLARASVLGVRAVANSAWSEIRAVGALFDALKDKPEDAAGIDWTMFRVGGLADGEEGEVVVAPGVGAAGTWFAVTRADVARWLVEQVGREEQQWVGEKPYLSTKGKGVLDMRMGNVFK